MKKKPVVNEEKHELEIIKAVAQAWHGRSTNSTRQQTNEFDAYRNKHKNKPTRFKLEAMSKASKETVNDANWDFGQSLWDSYELVTVSKRLESGLALDDQLMSGAEDQYLSSKRRKESKNSLRRLITRMSSSKRFDVNTPPGDDDLDQF